MSQDTPLYAIVDIEATSGSLGTNEGMIQFACVLMQDGEIIEEFETLVNPMQNVPIRIQKLTGITQKEVNQAPLFEEIAHIIRDLLEDAIFVAHNVSFDYQFLNEQFEAVGLKPLSSVAIDTVALSQIVFPRAHYYNLQELTSYLGYAMDNAHNALHDARATAYLLDKIINKLTTLPLVTLEKLVELSNQLSFQSDWLIKNVFKLAQQNPSDLKDNLMIYEGMAIVDPSATIEVSYHSTTNDYPMTLQDKKRFFNSSFQLRKHQGELMDNIFYYFEKESNGEELAIEAPSGMGKSIGYLVPSVLNRQRVVISTHTRTLQDQLLNEAIPLLREVTALNPSAVVLKGCEHYLSLANFKQALSHVSKEDTEAFICMQLLVWLTETKTGDLNELGVHSLKQHPFWNKIITQFVQLDSMQDYDFYPRLIDEAARADLIITNHAHLMTDLNRDKSVIPSFDYLIVDEAQHLPRIMTALSQLTFSKPAINRLMRDIGERNSSGSIVSQLEKFTQQEWIKPYQLQAIESTRYLLTELNTNFFSQFNRYFKDTPSDNGWIDLILEDNYFSQTPKDIIRHLKQAFEDLIFQLQDIYKDIMEHEDELSVSERILIDNLYKYLTELQVIYETFSQLCVSPESDTLTWLEAYSSSPETSVRVKSLSQKAKNRLLDKLHLIKHIIYISSTLSVNNSVEFFEKQIKASKLTYLEFLSPYHLQDQAKFIIPDELKPIKKLSSKHLTNQLVTDIIKITRDLNRKTLILFHSHEVLQGVYHKLQNSALLSDYDLLAQDFSGSRHKILKQFKQSEKSILFGSDSFFEGIDLPGDLLEVVILTRLPFDSPDMPIVKNEHNRMKKAGSNIFMEDILPRAIIKTKQAFGRLIRSEKDKGVFVMLDDRYLNANYSHMFQNSIPNGDKFDRVPMHEIPEVINHFLSHH